MKTLKRWIKNFKWLFNHPTTDTTQTHNHKQCEFCGCVKPGYSESDGEIVGFSICYDCRRKAFRKVLAPKKSK